MKQTTFEVPIQLIDWTLLKNIEYLFNPELLLKRGYLQVGVLIKELEKIVGTIDDIRYLGTDYIPLSFVDENPILEFRDIFKFKEGYKSIETKKYPRFVEVLGGENSSANLIMRVQKCPITLPESMFSLEANDYYTDRIIAVAADTSIDRALKRYFMDKGWRVSG